jgi:hypothetical protein
VKQQVFWISVLEKMSVYDKDNISAKRGDEITLKFLLPLEEMTKFYIP